MDEVRTWLQSMNLEQYHQLFVDNDLLSLPSVKLLNEKDLIQMNITLIGHQKRLLLGIEALSKSKTYKYNGQRSKVEVCCKTTFAY